jgi:hypothetical protein
MLILTQLKHRYQINLSCSALGHTYAGLVVSFLLVARINSTLARYNDSNGYIGIMYRETRECFFGWGSFPQCKKDLVVVVFFGWEEKMGRKNPLTCTTHLSFFLLLLLLCPTTTGEMVQKAVIFSRKGNNTDLAAKEWRSELAYRVLLLLRTTVSTIEYPSAKIPAYEIPELSGMEWHYVQPDRKFLQRAEIPSCEETDSIRVPTRMAQLVRETICSQLSRLAHPMNVQEELNMLASVDKFQEGYYGIRKFRVCMCV